MLNLRAFIILLPILLMMVTCVSTLSETTHLSETTYTSTITYTITQIMKTRTTTTYTVMEKPDRYGEAVFTINCQPGDHMWVSVYAIGQLKAYEYSYKIHAVLKDPYDNIIEAKEGISRGSRTTDETTGITFSFTAEYEEYTVIVGNVKGVPPFSYIMKMPLYKTANIQATEIYIETQIYVSTVTLEPTEIKTTETSTTPISTGTPNLIQIPPTYDFRVVYIAGGAVVAIVAALYIYAYLAKPHLMKKKYAKPVPKRQTIKCLKCGSTLPKDSKFCDECGTKQ